jgi:hypothetical protein
MRHAAGWLAVVACSPFAEATEAPASRGAGTATLDGAVADAASDARATGTCDAPSFCLGFDRDPALDGWTRDGGGLTEWANVGPSPPAMRFSANDGQEVFFSRLVTFTSHLDCDVDFAIETGQSSEARYIGARLSPAPQRSFSYWVAEWGIKEADEIAWIYYASSTYGESESYPTSQWTRGTTWSHLSYRFDRSSSSVQMTATAHPVLPGPASSATEPLTFRFAVGVVQNEYGSHSILFDNLRCSVE